MPRVRVSPLGPRKRNRPLWVIPFVFYIMAANRRSLLWAKMLCAAGGRGSRAFCVQRCSFRCSPKANNIILQTQKSCDKIKNTKTAGGFYGMNCRFYGTEIGNQSRFCSSCGKPQDSTTRPAANILLTVLCYIIGVIL